MYTYISRKREGKLPKIWTPTLAYPDYKFNTKLYQNSISKKLSIKTVQEITYIIIINQLPYPVTKYLVQAITISIKIGVSIERLII